MRYVSTFSGIEAASVAWEPLGWKPVGFSEIEPFASAVLAHRFPGVTNYGDITKHAEWDIGPGAVDLLVGGSPCQAFSVAGLRKGLDDPRGQLTLVYLQLAARLEPEWIVWENVPGVLSADGGRAFGAFLGGLAELGYGFAWRVLDARYFGVPQRRRRVFLVARRSGDWESCAKVLLEPEGMHRNPASGDEPREAPSGAAADGARAGGVWWDGGDTAASLTTRCHDQSMPDKGNFAAVLQEEIGALDTQCGGENLSNQTATAGHLIPIVIDRAAFNQGTNAAYEPRIEESDWMSSLVARGPHAVAFRKSRRAQNADDHETWVADGTANTLNGFDVGDVRTTHAVAIPIQDGREIEKKQNGFGIGDPNDPAYTLDTTGAQSIAFTDIGQGQRIRSADGVSETLRSTQRGPYTDFYTIAHAFYSTGGSHGLEPQPNVCPPLKVGSGLGIPSPPAVAYPIDGRNAMRDPDKHDEVNRQGVGVGNAGDPAHTVTTACVHAVCFSCKDHGADAGDVAPTMRAMPHSASHANGGGQLAVAVDVYNQTVDGDCAATVTAAAGGTNTSGPKVVSFAQNQVGEIRVSDVASTIGTTANATARATPKIQTGMIVRRLTPVECERLQGFPDGWTDIPYRGKPAPDGPRYKALGNSMAVPCMAWIGQRIQMVMDGRL